MADVAHATKAVDKAFNPGIKNVGAYEDTMPCPQIR